MTGLLLCHDFFFISKIAGTAAELGIALQEVGRVEEAVAVLQKQRPGLVIVDLSAAGARLPELLAALPGENRPAVIAFDAHVNGQRLQGAKEAGCDVVLPRSRFSAELPELLRRFASGKAAGRNQS